MSNGDDSHGRGGKVVKNLSRVGKDSRSVNKVGKAIEKSSGPKKVTKRILPTPKKKR
jgi:hypothetical protein